MRDMLWGLLTVMLLAHVALLIWAPYSGHYFGCKKSAFLIGLGALVLLPFVWPIALGVSLPILVGSVVVAEAATLIALSAANFSVSKGWRYLLSAHANLFRQLSPRIALLLLLSALYEEAIWRLGLQRLFGGGAFSIAITGYSFALAHVCPSRKVRYPRMLDVGAFSLLMGVGFAVTQSFVFVTLVHVGKNCLIEAVRRAHDDVYRQRQMLLTQHLRSSGRRWHAFARTSAEWIR
jgi:hypothetical protein